MWTTGLLVLLLLAFLVWLTWDRLWGLSDDIDPWQIEPRDWDTDDE